MKRDHFEDLKEVVGILKPNEVRTARKFITAFEGNATKGKNKSLLLFELILKKPAIELVEMEQKLGYDLSKKSQAKSFKNLTTRLQSKLVESIFLDVNLDRADIYGPFFRNDKQLRKRLMETVVLIGRGLYGLSLKRLEDIHEQAKDIEAYQILVEVIGFKQELDGVLNGGKNYYEYCEQQEEYILCYMATKRARNLYSHHFALSDFSGLHSDNVSFLLQAVSELDQKYKITNSCIVGYHFFILKIELLLAQEKYAECVQVNVWLIEMMIERQIIFSKSRWSTAISDLADNELFIFDFTSSLRNLDKASIFHSVQNSLNDMMAKEIQLKN